MTTSQGSTMGAGVLGDLLASMQQGFLWLSLLLGGFLVHALWFWLRVFRRGYSSVTEERSSRIPGPPQQPYGSVDESAAAAETGCHSSLRHRRVKLPTEKSEAAGPRKTVGEDGAFDSADEADSEAEQDSLLPAAEQRRRFPRRMSFHSSNLAAGCFPPASKVQHNVVSACLYTANLPSTKSVLHLIQTRLVKFHRLRSVPVPGFFYPHWREVFVNPAAHFRRLRVRDALELHLCIEWIMSQPCDQNRPRWQLWLIENETASQYYEQQQQQENPQQEQQQRQQQREVAEIWSSAKYRTKDEQRDVCLRLGFASPPRHCIVIRAEHCIGDGLSLIELGMRLLTDAKGLPLNEWKELPLLKPSSQAAAEHLCQLPSPTAHMLRWTKVLLRAPRRCAEAMLVGAFMLLGCMRTLAAAAVRKRDACTPLTGRDSARNSLKWCSRARVAAAPPVSLDLVKAIKRASSSTLNDVFVAAFTGAVRRYCELRGDKQFSKKGSVKLPKILLACAFFRRTRELPDSSQLLLRNRFTLSSLELPANSKDEKETLLRVQQATVALKRSHQAAADFLCQKVLGQLLPRIITQKAAECLFNTHSAVFSNLPAYTAPVHFCGSEITEVQVCYPNLIPQVEVVSYARRIFFSFVYDPTIVAEGHAIPRLFVEELFRLADAFRVPKDVLETEKQKYSELCGR